jgi:SAM-dependent methyltransferase
MEQMDSSPLGPLKPSNSLDMNVQIPLPIRRPLSTANHRRDAPLGDLPIRDEIIYQYLPLNQASDVLEIGPGNGYTAYWLAQQLRSLTLVDIAAQSLRALETRLASRSNIRFLQWDVCEPGLAEAAGRKFDAAFGLDIFEYMTDARAALCNLASVLKPGGMLFLFYPNFAPGTSHGIHYFRNVAEAQEALQAAGFQRWDIFPVRLRPFAGALFKIFHEVPLRLYRGHGCREVSDVSNFDATWTAQQSGRLERYKPFINSYWDLLGRAMRFRGPAYQRDPGASDIVGRQLVIRAWR